MMAVNIDQCAEDVGPAACPFCDESEEIYLRFPKNNPRLARPQIQCESCGAIGPTWNADNYDTEGEDYKAIIVSEWNDRAAIAKAKGGEA